MKIKMALFIMVFCPYHTAHSTGDGSQITKDRPRKSIG